MTLRTADYALLSQASYQDPAVASRRSDGVEYKQVTLDGIEYKPIDHADNPITGFQGTAYRRIDTGEVVIAFRGTEFGREPLHDGVLADAAMVFAGVNAQTGDAAAFAQRVMGEAKALAQANHQPLSITVTGHSLGGTLAEIIAYRYGLHGETFNSYGAAGLMEGVPVGGDQVIDHVRVTDVVSAGSTHFGLVREYATARDIDHLHAVGYRDSPGGLRLRDPLAEMVRDGGDAHGIAQFTPDGQGLSLISAENESRARAHHGMIERYRRDVMNLRGGLSAAWELPRTAISEVEQSARAAGTVVYDGALPLEHGAQLVGHEAMQGARAAERGVQRAAQVTVHEVAQAFETLRHPGRWFEHAPATPPGLEDASHPDHALYQQARTAVHRLDAEHSRTPDLRSDQLAAALVVAARRDGLKCIDQVVLGDDSSHVFALQGPRTALSAYTQLPTLGALNTPLAQSGADWLQLMQAKAIETAPAAPPPLVAISVRH